MSGIVGILNVDGAPVDSRLLERMTRFMVYRGPDDQQLWTHGQIGFGHAMLRTTIESAGERQPCTLDGEVWITADARVDGRADLIEKLGSHGRKGLPSATDPELILHAYQIYGPGCLEYLLGDFAFAIWDGRERRLFCARDHFGVKPLYYAESGKCLVFSNTLNCLRMHPAVSDELNDSAIGDFLLFGLNQEPSTTTYSDIRRLPPAHSLTWSHGTTSISRYWRLPVDRRVRYRRKSHYVEHFKQLLRMAVEDRLRTDRAVVLMSGGLDSTAVAATAQELLSKRSAPYVLRASTAVYDRLIPDQERYYAGLVAQALQIPIDYLVMDNYRLYERSEEPELQWPEPYGGGPLLAMYVDEKKRIASHSRVALTGLGGDNGLYHEWRAYVVDLLKGLRLGVLAMDLGRFVVAHRRLPLLGSLPARLRWLKRPNGNAAPPFLYPSWLDPALEARLGLRQRWEAFYTGPPPVHRLRPKAFSSLEMPFWQGIFEGYDPSFTRLPLETRHPFFDVRLVDFLLAIPPLPWCVDKYLLREAMRGILPEPVRRRPKAPVPGNPVAERVRQSGVPWSSELAPELGSYVNWDRVLQVGRNVEPTQVWPCLLPLSLNCWLQYSARMKYKL